MSDPILSGEPGKDCLEVLSLEGTIITDAGLRHIGKLPKLCSLNLTGTLITSAGLAELQNLQALTDLYIGDTSVDTSAFEHLARLPNLRLVNVEESQISDEELGHFQLQKKMREDLRFAQLRAKGGRLEIADAVTRRMRLVCEGEQFGDSDVDFVDIEVGWLGELSFSRSRLTDKGLEALLGKTLSLFHLTSLDLSHSSISGEPFRKLKPRWKLGTVREIRKLRLDGCAISDEDIRYLKRLRELRNLSLAGTPVSDAGLKNLSKLRRLRTLDLRFTRVTPAGVSGLQEALPKLEIVW